MADFPKVNEIAPENETGWYRRYWIRTFSLLLLAFFAGLYWIVKWAVMAALMELEIK